MVGPADYLGNLEGPDEHLYTVDTESFPPVWYRKPTESVVDGRVVDDRVLTPFDDSLVTTVKVRWIRGDTDEIDTVNEEYHVTSKDVRQSLFLRPGLLEIIDTDLIELQNFDARDVDLSSFKVRLYRNDSPFRISFQKLPPADEYRMVTYLYNPGYTARVVNEGSGLFLERHEFAQTMTPIDQDSKGFIKVARTNDQPDELEIIGIQIPFGYTLVVDPDAIHGDATFDGFYCMGMTSNHVTMRTADTVFLKSRDSKRNVFATIAGAPQSSGIARPNHISPFVLFKNHTPAQLAHFCEQTRGLNFVFMPKSKAFWKTYFRSRSIWPAKTSRKTKILS